MPSLQIEELFSNRALLLNAIASAVLVLGVLLARSAALRVVRRSDWATEQMQLRWTVQVRWGSLILVVLGLVVVWAEELRTLALSVVAIAAALAIATKELIACLGGALLRSTSNSFSVGDRIEISGVRGDVVDLRPLTTTILEVGPGHRRTGRAVILPNAIMLGSPVVNETFTDEFVVHLITVPIDQSADYRSAEQALLEAARAACAPFLEEARRHMDATAKRHGLPVLSVEPRVNVQIPDVGKLHLMVRVPTRARDKGQTEQDVLRRYLDASRRP